MPGYRGKDRRVQRTEDLLHGALASLIHEKAYDAIVVKEILARANVGRSTFYAHFRDKDELLESGIRDVLRASESASSTRLASPAERVLRFSLPMLEHIERYRGADGFSADPRGLAVVHQRLQAVLAELIAADLSVAPLPRAGDARGVPCDLLARHVASTFVLVLSWWVEHQRPLSAGEASDLFRALVLPALTQWW